MSNKLELPSIEGGTVEQVYLKDLWRQHITLQDQFDQLTNHVQECYRRIEALHKIISSKVLS